MKKIIIAMMAVAFAACANAAAVAWNSGTFADGFAGPQGENLKGSSAYTIAVSFFSDAQGSSLLTSSTATAASTKNGGYSGTTTGYDFASGSTYYAQAIITANDGSASYETKIAEFSVPTTGNASVNFTTGAGFASTGNQWSSSGWKSGSVPEPTTGVLLLLGLAGLALKRKNA